MFKFLKDKIKKGIEKFTKQIDEEAQEETKEVEATPEEVKEDIKEEVEQIKEKVEDLKEEVKEKPDKVEEIKEKVEELKEEKEEIKKELEEVEKVEEKKKEKVEETKPEEEEKEIAEEPKPAPEKLTLPITRDEALKLVKEHTKEKSDLNHYLESEAIMKALARKLGEDEEVWGMLGLVHDVDWGITKDNSEEHLTKAPDILRKAGFSDDFIGCVLSHGYGFDCAGLKDKKRTKKVEHALACSETVTGLIHAYALMRGSIDGMQAKGLKKKFKDKAFAAAINRDIIKECEKLGLELGEFLGLAIEAVKGIAAEVGLVGEEPKVEEKKEEKVEKPIIKEKKPEPIPEPTPEPKKEGFLKKIFKKKEEPELKKEEPVEEEAPSTFLGKIKHTITTKKINEKQFEDMFWELELALLENNVAVEVIDRIKQDLKTNLVDKAIPRTKIMPTILSTLKNTLTTILEVETINVLDKISEKKPYVICFIGINGSGKTTTIAKFAKMMQDKNLKPVLAAADTFRAAAIHQLEEHGERLDVKVIKHDYGSDPAAVAFDAIKYAKSKGLDVVLIDTAGRMHSNINLVDEMKKIIRVANPDLKIFVGESITGNDCVEQAKKFNEAVEIDGIILSKADIDEKGGAALSVSYVTGKPVLYIGTGQEYKDLELFNSEKIITNLGL